MRFELVVIVLVCIMLTLVGHTLYETDLENNETRDIYNLTETMLNVNNFNLSYDDMNSIEENYSIDNLPEIRVYRVEKILNSFINFVLVTSFEGSKYFIEFGYTHPEYDYEFYFYIIRLYLIAMIVIMASPLIIPVFVLLYLIGLGIFNLFKMIKSMIINRRLRNGNFKPRNNW